MVRVTPAREADRDGGGGFDSCERPAVEGVARSSCFLIATASDARLGSA
jgi:hypothetical protein